MTTDQIGHGVALMHRRNRRVWLAKRRRVLGATDAVAVLGYSKFKTPLDVWLEKTGRAEPDNLDDKYVVQRGNVLEGLIITEWSRRNGAALVEFPPLLGHPHHRMLAASLDAVGDIDTRQRTICEAKAVTWRAKDDWWDDAVMVPDQYAVQVLIQLAVTGLDVAHICADVAGEYRQVVIERDFDFEAWALPALADWWERHVVGGEEPDIDPVRDYPRLNHVWRPAPGVSIDADDYLTRAITIHRAATIKKKAVQGVIDSARGRIRVAMRDATQVLDPATGDRLAALDKGGRLTVAKGTTNPTREETL
ncbi:MAG: YqaJ viral recombinase family protein [bacterium]|nr:YqaJ viral recombinase family protein [bacterium]